MCKCVCVYVSVLVYKYMRTCYVRKGFSIIIFPIVAGER